MGTTIKHKRKAGAFISGDLAAAEWGLDITNDVWYFSTDGTDVVALSTSADIAALTHAATSKTTPVDADELPLVDSAASNVLKRLTWANLKATVKTYFDTLYQALDADLTALAALASTAGMLARTGAGAFAVRTITGTANQVTVSNGDGASGNPTLSLPQSIATTSTPTFGKLTVTGTGTSGEVQLDRHGGDLAGEGMSVRNVPFGVSGLGNIAFYPSTGTNTGASFSVIPKGTGSGIPIKAQFSIFGTDFLADSTNYEFLTLRGDGVAFNLFSTKAGTGTVRPIRLQTSTIGAAIGNAGIYISTTNQIGIGTDSPTAMLDVNSDTLRLRTAKTPASAGAAGNQGDIAWDSSFIYICVAASTWKRVAISTW